MRCWSCTPLFDGISSWWLTTHGHCHPAIVEAVSDLPANDSGYLAGSGTAVAKAALARGVFLRPLGSTIYVMPPYCATPADLRSVWEVVRAVL